MPAIPSPRPATDQMIHISSIGTTTHDSTSGKHATRPALSRFRDDQTLRPAPLGRANMARTSYPGLDELSGLLDELSGALRRAILDQDSSTSYPELLGELSEALRRATQDSWTSYSTSGLTHSCGSAPASCGSALLDGRTIYRRSGARRGVNTTARTDRPAARGWHYESAPPAGRTADTGRLAWPAGRSAPSDGFPPVASPVSVGRAKLPASEQHARD